jgi:hypothetical protein
VAARRGVRDQAMIVMAGLDPAIHKGAAVKPPLFPKWLIVAVNILGCKVTQLLLKLDIFRTKKVYKGYVCSILGAS